MSVALRDREARTGLDCLQKLEVIAAIDEPTPWVSSLTVVVKKSGALSICIDPRPLNTALKRERHQLPMLDDILPKLSKLSQNIFCSGWRVRNSHGRGMSVGGRVGVEDSGNLDGREV